VQAAAQLFPLGLFAVAGDRCLDRQWRDLDVAGESAAAGPDDERSQRVSVGGAFVEPAVDLWLGDLG
jgi:hypothetical protein